MLHIRLIWDRISSQFNLDIIFLKLRIKLNFNYCNTRWLQTNIKRPRNPSNLMWNVLTGEALILALWFLLITSQSGISTKAAFRTDDNMMDKLTILLFNIGKISICIETQEKLKRTQLVFLPSSPDLIIPIMRPLRTTYQLFLTFSSPQCWGVWTVYWKI